MIVIVLKYLFRPAERSADEKLILKRASIGSNPSGSKKVKLYFLFNLFSSDLMMIKI